MEAREPELVTVGVLARRVGASISQVNRLLLELGIRPAARAGTLRVFRPGVVKQVADALRDEIEVRGPGA